MVMGVLDPSMNVRRQVTVGIATPQRWPTLRCTTYVVELRADQDIQPALCPVTVEA